MAMVTMMLRMVHTMTMLMDGDVDDDGEDGVDDDDDGAICPKQHAQCRHYCESLSP